MDTRPNQGYSQALHYFVSVASGDSASRIPARAAGPKAYVGNFKDNTVSVIDIAEKRVLTTVPVPPGPHGIAITPDNRWVYVASDGASTVSVIDTATDKLVQNIEVGKNPHGVAVTPNGKLILVGVYDTDTVAFIDTETEGSGQRPGGQATQYRGSSERHYRLRRLTDTGEGFSLAIIDLQSRTVKDRAPR